MVVKLIKVSGRRLFKFKLSNKLANFINKSFVIMIIAKVRIWIAWLMFLFFSISNKFILYLLYNLKKGKQNKLYERHHITDLWYKAPH